MYRTTRKQSFSFQEKLEKKTTTHPYERTWSTPDWLLTHCFSL